jgi:hypothetical protein
MLSEEFKGIWRPQSCFRGETVKMPFSKNILVDFDEKGKYSLPEFTFNQTTGLTALKFLDGGGGRNMIMICLWQTSTTGLLMILI